jgi:hypothetical protein
VTASCCAQEDGDHADEAWLMLLPGVIPQILQAELQACVVQFMGGEYAQMWMIATPTKPGWCRCLWWFFTPAQPVSKRTKVLARLPTWLDHQTRSAGRFCI